MRRVVAAALALLLGCGQEALDPTVGPPPAGRDALEVCRADAEAFVLRTLPWLHGRRPLGVAEVELLAGAVDELDARGHDGRRTLALRLAQGPSHRRRWTSEIFDLMRTRRAGHRVLPRCYGERGPAADSAALARHVVEQSPQEGFGTPWTMLDLIESSLRADDLRPVLLADLLVRMSAPVDDANTAPDDLERARRTNFGRSFEAVYLGRRFECLSCHRDDASVTDHPDPALDRFWPVAQGLERSVFAADEASMHAVFRVEGFGGGGLAPWGIEDCGTVSAERSDDPLGERAWLAGPLPAGADALDLMERLRQGLDRLAIDGWSDAPAEDTQALAQLVVLHLVDGIWAAVTGRRLTLDHGTPRNRAQAERLRSLAVAFVGSRYSLRHLLAEIAADVHLDQASPDRCESDAPEPLPAIFDPFTADNGAGHLVHRRDPFALVDEAHRVLGLPLPGLHIGQAEFDATLVGALGAYLREAEPGHEGLDLLGALAWEQALVDREALVPDGEVESEDLAVSIDELVSLARVEPSATVGELMIAIKDRVLADPEIDAEERMLVEALVGVSWSEPAASRSEAELRELALRYARVLMATPEFVLMGLERAPAATSTPRLRAAALQPDALCAHWAQRLTVRTPWSCDDGVLALP